MRKICFLLILSCLLLPQQAAAKPSEHLNFGTQLNAAECNTTGARLVINVIQHIINDADSGEFGNYWAYDEFQRRIQVWQLSPYTFCAVLKYMGSFLTVPGQSPGFFDADSNDTCRGRGHRNVRRGVPEHRVYGDAQRPTRLSNQG